MAKKIGGKKLKIDWEYSKGMIIGAIVLLLAFIGCAYLTGKYTKEFFDSKNYETATAYVVGEVKVNKVTEKDKYGNIKSEHKYYDYEYVYEVDGMEYSGEKSNFEGYFGDEFEVLYDADNPGKHVIGDEATFPIGLYLASLFVLVLLGYTVYRIITD